MTYETVSGEKPLSLEQKVDKLTALIERENDARQIQNIVSKMSYLWEAGMYEGRMEFVAKKTPGVVVEWGSRGVFEGVEGARRCFVQGQACQCLLAQFEASGRRRLAKRLHWLMTSLRIVFLIGV